MKVVESITSKRFQDFFEDEILSSIGINSNIFAKQYPYIDKSDKAIPFDKDLQADDYRFSVAFLLVCVQANELNTWMHALYDGSIISKESTLFIARNNKFNEDAQSPLGNLGYDAQGSVEYHHHHGNTDNFESVITYDGKKDLYIVLLTNQKNGNLIEITSEITRLVNH